MIPEAHHPIWADVLEGRRTVDLEFVAARMLIVRLRLTLARNASTLAQGCVELRHLFDKNRHLASVQRDLDMLRTQEARAAACSLSTVDEVRSLIQAGRSLLLAGDERLLRHLPAGHWIAGTIPYFVTEAGGTCSRDRVFVTELPPAVESVSIDRYDERTIERVYEEGTSSGFSVIIIPASSRTHLGFALRAPNYPAFGVKPLVGWVAGVHLSELGRARAKVFDGRSGEGLEEGAVVLRAHLAAGKVAEVGTVNIFDPGEGPAIGFEQDGFSATEAIVDGRRRPFAAWVREQRLDLRLPLVADYLGTRVNVSFQALDEATREVRFYAPVFAGVKYRHARPVPDPAGTFLQRLPDESAERVAFSCNCILNYDRLEGKRTGVFTGPVTFGEIAYQLLNQTLAYVVVQDHLKHA